MEEYRAVRDTPVYEVSNLGKVRRVGSKRASVLARGGVLKQSITGSPGYCIVCIRGKVRYVHALVAQAFLPPKNDGEVVIHLDMDRLNNAVGNLAYVPRSVMALRYRKITPKVSKDSAKALRADFVNGFSIEELMTNYSLTRGRVKATLVGAVHPLSSRERKDIKAFKRSRRHGKVINYEAAEKIRELQQSGESQKKLSRSIQTVPERCVFDL